ncbi:MAG: hypothetical protein ABSG53_17055 [Thermoguttaceae bacterium]
MIICPPTPRPELIDQAVMRRHYEALYGTASEEDGHVCLYNGRNTWFVPPRNIERLIDWTSAFGTMRDIYHLVALIDPAAEKAICERHGRGDEKEIKSIVALVADVDAGKPDRNYPSQKQVVQALDSMPCKPSLVNLSGRANGGVHVFWLLDRPWRIESPECLTHAKDVSKRWQALLREKLKPFDLDATHDMARVLRPAGSPNHKYAATVQPMIYVPDRRVSLSDFESALPPPPQHTNGRAPHVLPTDYDRSNVIERARRYIAKIPGGVLGHGYDRTTFHVGCVLVLGFALSPADALPIIGEWNLTCEPPWSEGDLVHKLDGADAQPGTRGYLLEKHREQSAPASISHGDTTRSLEDYRAEMVQARLDSVLLPGTVNFDGSPTGSGKSRADIPAARLAGSSLTVLPVHRNCEELESEYRKAGLSAVAYPSLTKKTCRNHDEAIAAIDAGLTASTCICFTCRFRNDCNYRDTLKSAEKAMHKIATHKRTELSFEAIAHGAAYISIHEDPTEMFRPTVEITAGLETIVEIAQHAKDEAADRHDDSAYHFFWKMEECTYWLIDAFKQASVTVNLTLPTPASKPNKTDFDLWQSIRSLGVKPDGDAMRLTKALAAGELHEVSIRVDQVFARGRQPETHKAILGITQTELPHHATIWVNDATGNRENIENLVGRPVIDRTPGGRITQRHRVVQVPIDITQSTSARRLLVIFQTVLHAFPDFSRIGVVCHRRHVSILNGAAKRGPVLDQSLRARIAKIEYFRGGENRASNHWTEECDLLIVAGTPRVPPSVVRTHLLRTGKHDAAALKADEQWTVQSWTGQTEDGQPCEVESPGYSNLEWGAAHHALVHAELLQTVGRGRAICENGIPVVVLSNEPFAKFPILDLKIDGGRANDSDFRVISALRELSTDSPTGEEAENDQKLSTGFPIYILGKTVLSFSSSAVAKKAGLPRQTTIDSLNRLLARNLVVKHGKRGGWSLPVDSCSPAAPVAAGVSEDREASQ